MDSTQGKLLVASARLIDPNFIHSIVLMVQHDENGALGLILNRPLKTTIKEACEKALEGVACEIEGFLHQGGPCEGPLMALHTADSASQAEVISGVHFTTQREQIEWLLAQPDVQAKFFVGYAGWGAGQLETELETGSWLLTSVADDQVFHRDDRAWQKLVKQITLGQWIDPKRIPEDPSVN